ncbi:hypothetical protein BJ170DRAFT_598103 [Xylariales sp. AK1849]|nr:hypothetical protein BJ170DRAFT_598103 [Xylariales sp. AK1849]
MAYRGGGARSEFGGGGRSDFDDRESRYYRDGPRRPPPREYDDVEIYERREERRSSPPRRAPVREYEDTEISIRERDRVERTPAFLREEPRREAGPLVLRSREVETIDRRRPRSPSPVREEERIMIRRRSISPGPLPERTRTRIVERETRERSPAPPSMAMERRPRFIERSPSPPEMRDVRVDTRIIERRRERSPTPEREQEIRIIQRERTRVPSPSPSPPPPPPPPQVIRGPTIEREVITHYRDIDHGVERIKAPSPPPPPQPRPARTRERETDIDIYTSRNETEVDIHKRTRSRSRPRERERPRERPQPASRPSYYDDEVLIQSDRDRLLVDIEHNHRRSRSVAPPPRPDYAEESEYITSKIDSRGRMGEAWGGATKDWTIVDVPPGTERVKMDGVGGGGAEVTWQRYNGVRRSKFVPEREGTVVSSSASVVESVREREPVSREDKLSVQIYDKHREPSRDRSVVEDVHDTRISIRDRDRDRGRRAPRKPQEMWTEITKDLVVREAVEKMGYEYEETEFFFYVMEYLRYEDVLELVNISDTIRRSRRERAREIEWEREARDRWENKHRHRRSAGGWDDERERIYEHEVVYDRKPVRGYLR